MGSPSCKTFRRVRRNEDKRGVIPTLKGHRAWGVGDCEILANSRLGLQDVKPPVRRLVVGTTTSFLQTAPQCVVLSPFTNEKIVLRSA